MSTVVDSTAKQVSPLKDEMLKLVATFKSKKEEYNNKVKEYQTLSKKVVAQEKYNKKLQSKLSNLEKKVKEKKLTPHQTKTLEEKQKDVDHEQNRLKLLETQDFEYSKQMATYCMNMREHPTGTIYEKNAELHEIVVPKSIETKKQMDISRKQLAKLEKHMKQIKDASSKELSKVKQDLEKGLELLQTANNKIGKLRPEIDSLKEEMTTIGQNLSAMKWKLDKKVEYETIEDRIFPKYNFLYTDVSMVMLSFIKY